MHEKISEKIRKTAHSGKILEWAVEVHKKKIKRVLQSHIADVPCHPSQGRDR